MSDQNEQQQQRSDDTPNNMERTGDPGVTPGEAEGDEETVEESIRQHEQKGDL